MRKIGIIGGSGYVGYSLSKYLCKYYNIKIVDINKPKKDLEDQVEFVECDINDYNKLKESISDVDVVIHTAIIQIPLINEEKKLGYNVNFLGTQNVCKVVEETDNVKGLILCGSWHTIGERELSGLINEEFGFRPDKVEERARLYALSKMAQEAVVRYYDEMSTKIYGIIRMGTVLGEGMPEQTAANIFIKRGLKGEPITPYKHSMYRPMLYVDINDICKAFKQFVDIIINNDVKKENNSLNNTVNVYYPDPITIIKLAEYIKQYVFEISDGKIDPPIEVVDKGINSMFSKMDVDLINVDITKLNELLNMNNLIDPKTTIKRLIQSEYK